MSDYARLFRITLVEVDMRSKSIPPDDRSASKQLDEEKPTRVPQRTARVLARLTCLRFVSNHGRVGNNLWGRRWKVAIVTRRVAGRYFRCSASRTSFPPSITLRRFLSLECADAVEARWKATGVCWAGSLDQRLS